MKNKINNKAIMALSQIFILIVSIVAFSYIVGSEFRVVSAADVPSSGGDGCDDNDVSYSGSQVTFEYGSPKRTYIIQSSTRITRADGWWYSKNSGGSWNWHSPSGGEGTVDSSSEGSYFSTWNTVTENAVECYDEEIANKETSTGFGSGECNDYCQNQYGYDSGACTENCQGIPSGKTCDGGKECCCYSSLTDPVITPNDVDPTQTPSNTPDLVQPLTALPGLIPDFKDEDDVEPTKIDPETGKEIPEDGGVPGATDGDDAKVKPPFGWEGKKGYVFGGIVKGLMWAAGIAAGIQLLKAFLPERSYRLLNTLTAALAVGAFVGRTSTGIVQAVTDGAKTGIGTGIGVGVGVAAIIFLVAYRKESQEIITFTCHPWEAPTGGDNCDECNDEILPCSEYQCRSLGQACELVNPGTEEEKCVWVNKGDVEFPIIQPLEDALLNGYEYTPDNAISPPDKGVRIEYTESTSGRARAFSSVSFGITLNEPAKCKLDVLRKDNFDDMDFYFSNGLLLEEHEYTLSAPGTSALEAEGIELENDGEYEIYVRCQDANGNHNTANFVFLLGVEQGPDTTPPLIVTTDPLNDHPFAYNQSSIGVGVYVNEPVEGCRWSHVDQNYEDMENEMDCANADNLADMDARGYYSCDATLSGLNDGQDNKFYFRCRDLAENSNLQSYEYNLIGTQPLVIDWAGPNGTIKDSTDSIKVTLEAETSAGYNEGEASCYYSDTGETEDYVLFYNTGSYQHSQDLWLNEGVYEYFIRCVDLGGNIDVETVNFEVDSDSTAPIIVRAYHEETYLKLITNEEARCVYDTTYENYPCDYSYDDGIPFTTIEDINHYSDWNPSLTFYIICQDDYGNQPAPDTCSQIIRPSDIH